MEKVLLVIDDPVVEALAAEVAELTGLPVEEALREALELEVKRLTTARRNVSSPRE